jgi:dipeptidyl aminopeptidase/acylaminoacyl peptidase
MKTPAIKTLLISSMFPLSIGAQDHLQKTPLPFGSWPSPISAQMAAEGTLRFSEISTKNETIYWLEGRPWQNGRVALMSWDANHLEQELLPREYSVRSKVHEYGGGALCIGADKIYFINAIDQQVYSLDQNKTITQVTSSDNARFADGCENKHDGSLFYVMEEHAGQDVINSIVKISHDGSITKIATGNDFYSNPRISPDGNQLAYITWNHPHMPWDGTTVWVVDLASNQHRCVAGSDSESILDPQWSPDNRLYYVSDRNNWWNIYAENNEQPIAAIEGEFTLPPWTFNRSLFGFLNNEIVSSYVEHGVNKFCRILSDGTAHAIDLPYTNAAGVATTDTKIALIAGSSTTPSSIVLYDPKDSKSLIIKCSFTLDIDDAFKPTAIAIEFPTSENRTAHAFYYPPCSAHHIGLENEKPPLMVHSHGGPTGHVSPAFAMGIIYWTSRGFAVVDVNYGGSTGYGRLYRDRLKGQWGIVDVDDCTNAALYCVEQGLADAHRLTIEGGSAGGFTTLAALAFNNVFKVGANYFGVSDIERLALDTHKFESQYMTQLVGDYPAQRDVYIQRSPITHIDKITSPIIIFQGSEDAIVPPSQSEMMFESLKNRNIPTAYLLYEGEGHGFRKAENIIRSLEAQLYFYAKVLNIPLTEQITSIEIVNLP